MSFILPTFATRAVSKSLAFIRRHKASSKADSKAPSLVIIFQSKVDAEITTATAPQVAQTPLPPASRRRMSCKPVWSYKTDATATATIASTEAPRKRMSGAPVWFYNKPSTAEATSPLPAIPSIASDDSFDCNCEVPVRRGGKRSNKSKATPAVFVTQALTEEQPLSADDSFDYYCEVPVRRGGKRSKALASQVSRKRISGQPVWFLSPRLVAEPDLIAFEERRGSPLPSMPSTKPFSIISSDDSYSIISSSSDCSQLSSLISNQPFGGLDSLTSCISGQLPSLINNEPL